MAYYVLYRDVKKNRRAVDLAEIDDFIKDVIRKDQQAEKKRKDQGSRIRSLTDDQHTQQHR